MQTHQIKYIINFSEFLRIEGSPFAFWASENIFVAFEQHKKLSNYVECKSGVMTGDEKFLEFWFEPSVDNVKFDCKSYLDMKGFKWFPINSGGDFRKWYGNLSKVVDLWNNGENIRKFSKNYRLRDSIYYFKQGVTWGRITSSKAAFRIVKNGTLFGDAGPIGFIEGKTNYVLAFLSSNVVYKLLEFINPTLNVQVGDIMRLPLILLDSYDELIDGLTTLNIFNSKIDWDSFETSWDFKKHPLI